MKDVDSARASVARGITEIAAGLPGHLGVVVRYPEYGVEIERGARVIFAAASVIKVPIMVAVFAAVQRGDLTLDEELEYPPEDHSDGSGMVQYLHLGLRLTVRDALELMIDISDNTATNMLLRRIGGPPTVNAVMDGLGLTRTRSAAFIGRPNAPRSHEVSRLSRTTPREMADLLTLILHGKVVSQAASAAMMDILSHQQLGDMLPRYLPIRDDGAVSVANKTGSINGVRNDIGIVTVQTVQGARHAVVSAFTGGVRDGALWTPQNPGVLAVAQVGRLAYEGLCTLAGQDGGEGA